MRSRGVMLITDTWVSCGMINLVLSTQTNLGGDGSSQAPREKGVGWGSHADPATEDMYLQGLHGLFESSSSHVSQKWWS